MSGIISARAWGKVWAYRSTFLLGLLNTVETAIFAILLALVLGVIFGLMATSGKKILQAISRVYVEIMQNTPILLQLCFFYYALAFSGHSIGILPTGIVALGVYTGAYMAEVVRAGIEAVPKGQFEAAVGRSISTTGIFTGDKAVSQRDQIGSADDVQAGGIFDQVHDLIHHRR